MDAAQLGVTMKSEHPNRVTSIKLRPLASSTRVADCPTEVALMAHAKSEVGLNAAGSSPQPQLDEAVRLLARSRQRVDARFGGTVNVARDNPLRRMKMAISSARWTLLAVFQVSSVRRERRVYRGPLLL